MSVFLSNINTIGSDSCRICLNEDLVGGIDLSNDQNMLQLFEFCVGISINICHPPKRVCYKCVENIENYVKFKQKCLVAEGHWKSCVEHSQINTLPKCLENFETNVKVEVKREDTENDFCDEKDNNKQFNFDNKHDIPPLSCDSDKVMGDSYFNDDKCNLGDDINHYESTPVCDEIKKRYQCKNCNKEYSKLKWLVTHKTLCRKGLLKKINTHKKVKNKNVVRLEKSNAGRMATSSTECGLCNELCVTDAADHMGGHWSNNDLKCQLCSYCGRDFADMITHSYQHSPKKKLVCHVCKTKKASILSLQFHFRSIHLQKAGGICSICNKTFKKFKTWKRHERLHNENSLFICDHCGRKFLYKHEIKSHLIYHTDVRLFVCETCGKGFKRLSGLKDHIENLHRIKQPVKCDHCDKTYKSQSKLEIHLRNVAKEKPFICEVCSKKFISERVLQKHMFWHTGERPHSCEVCGSRYKAKGQLNLHMRNHTGFMPHKCVDCGKSFPAAKQLKRHQSVHTGVRAYKCMHCERSFHEKKTMLEHALQHKSSQDLKSEN